MTYRFVAETAQTPASVLRLVHEGYYAPAQRALCHLLETVVRYVAVDLRLPDASLDEKLAYLQAKVPRSSVTEVNEMALPLPDGLVESFRKDVVDRHTRLCAPPRQSRTQIDGYLTSLANGESLASHSLADAWAMSRLALWTYEVALVLVVTGLGQYLTGDVFAQFRDGNADWAFRTGKYINALVWPEPVAGADESLELSDNPGWIAGGDIGGDVVGDNGASADDAVLANRDAWEDDRAAADPYVAAHADQLG